MARKLKLARVLIVGLMLALALGVACLPASAQQFITVNFPGATSTFIDGVDHTNSTSFVGTYTDASNVTHGFLLRNGNYTTTDVPGSVQTIPQDVNDSGQVVGCYIDANNVSHGFLLSGGTFTTVDFPGSISTCLTGTTDSGEFAGGYIDQNKIGHVFLLNGNNFTVINIPGIPNTGEVVSLNNLGHLAGQNASTGDGFLFANGKVTTIDAPGCSDTFISDLNDSDQMTLECSVAPFGTFLYSAGTFTPINVPGAIQTGVTTLSDTGVLGGFYINSNELIQGFVETKGPFAYVGNALVTNCCSLTLLDTSTNLTGATISLSGGFGYPFAISPDQSHLYIPAGTVVDVIDTATNSVVAIISGVGPNANAVAIAPNGNFGYTANANSDNTSGSVSVFSTAGNSVVATIPLTFPAGGVNVTPDGSLVYASGVGSTIAVINASTNTVESTFSIPILAGGFNSNAGPVLNSTGSLGYVAQDVASVTPGTVTVISIPSNQTVATIRVGTQPEDTVITPDGTHAYVTNVGSNNVSVIDTSSNTVIATTAVGNQPHAMALTPDGAFAYVGNLADSTVSVIQTSTNSVVATIPMPSPFGILIPSAAPTTQAMTQPLSPTAPNQFNYGPHSFTVQYPPGTSFSGVNMTVAAAQTPVTSFKQRVSGTHFANATCVVYTGAGGNCVDYQVTCSNSGGGTISCPSLTTASIDVKSSYDTLQPIVNPAFLTAPIGTNEWENIFTAYYMQRIDPTMKGRTTGFSEFFAVDLGTSNEQGPGALQFQAPLQQNEPRTFSAGATIAVAFKLPSVANPSTPITDAIAGITVEMVSNAQGNPTAITVVEKAKAFTYQSGTQSYVYSLNTRGYAPGLYNLTVYGNAFVAQQVEFTLTAPTGPRISTTLQSLTVNATTKQYAAVFKLSNTGGAAAKNLAVTASKLDSTPTVTSLPANLGNLNPASSVNVTLLFPETAGAPNSSGEITISESYAGGTSGGGFRVTLP
jgi:YVTN family beta-propeller protein